MERKPKIKQAETQVPLPRLCCWILPLIPFTAVFFLYEEWLNLKTQKCSCLGEVPHALIAVPKTAMQGCVGSDQTGRDCTAARKGDRAQVSALDRRATRDLENESDLDVHPLLAGWCWDSSSGWKHTSPSAPLLRDGDLALLPCTPVTSGPKQQGATYWDHMEQKLLQTAGPCLLSNMPHTEHNLVFLHSTGCQDILGKNSKYSF